MYYDRIRDKYIMEHWTELFRIEIPSGSIPPKLYLPVKRDYFTNGIICWIFILAPLMMIMGLISGMLRSVWIDIMDITQDINRQYRFKTYVRKYGNNKPEEQKYIDKTEKQNYRRSFINIRFL